MKKELLEDLDLAAPIFAALGEPTRMALVLQIASEGKQNISRLAERTRSTRQAVSRHLFVLENVGLVTRWPEGREMFFALGRGTLSRLSSMLGRLASELTARS